MPHSHLPERTPESRIVRPPLGSSHLAWSKAVIQSAVELQRLRKEAIELGKVANGDKEAFRGFERDALEHINQLMLDNLGWNITHNDDLPEVDSQNDRVIYFGNHPTLTGIFPVAHFLAQHFAHNSFVIGDENVTKNWLYRRLLGDVMERGHKLVAIPKSKEDRARAFDIIGTEAHEALTPGSGGVILPDIFFPRKRAMRRERKLWSERMKNADLPDEMRDVSSWMTETTFPRSGGLWTFAEAVRDMEVRFLNITVIEPQPIHTIGGNFHIEVEEIPRDELFGDFSELALLRFRRKLIELWMEKNVIIRGKREEWAELACAA